MSFDKEKQKFVDLPPTVGHSETSLKNIIRELEKCTMENTSKFSFTTNGKVPCKIIHVHDGDTIDIAKYCTDGKIWSFKVRLNGVDTPELHPSLNIENRERIIESAESAKTFLEEKILNKILPIDIIGQDKYGRLLGILYENEEGNNTINESLILSGHAVPYDGGTKS